MAMNRARERKGKGGTDAFDSALRATDREREGERGRERALLTPLIRIVRCASARQIESGRRSESER